MHIWIIWYSKDLTLNYWSHTNTIKKKFKSMTTLFLHKKLDHPHNFHQLDELFPLQENTYIFFVCSQSSDKQTFGDNYYYIIINILYFDFKSYNTKKKVFGQKSNLRSKVFINTLYTKSNNLISWYINSFDTSLCADFIDNSPPPLLPPTKMYRSNTMFHFTMTTKIHRQNQTMCMNYVTQQ